MYQGPPFDFGPWQADSGIPGPSGSNGTDIPPTGHAPRRASVQRPSLVELKRSYLLHLPTERLVNTILELEMRGAKLEPSFGSHMWPPDLEAAVRDMDPHPGQLYEQERAQEQPIDRRYRQRKPKERAVPQVRERPPDKETHHPGTNGLPNYEEMICEALYDIGDEDGCPPKVIFDWIAERYPINSNFRPSAHQAIQKSAKRGRLEKTGNRYRLNADFDGSTVTTKKATRKPKAALEPTQAPTPPPPDLPLQSAAMSIEAALSLLVNSAPQPPRPPPMVVYNPPAPVQASLQSLAQQFAVRGRKRRIDGT